MMMKMKTSGAPPKESPLPGVQGLVTFYKLVLEARPPIAGMRVTMKGKEKDEGFVDVIADGGKEWIRIYRYASLHLPSPLTPPHLPFSS
jgi:hypothetical protein